MFLFGCFLYVDQLLKNVNELIGIENKNDKTFLCPLVPWSSCLGIFVNSYKIASLKWDSFARVVIWFIFGFTLYIFCRSKNSNLNFQKFASNQEQLLKDHKMGKKQTS